MKLQLSYEVMFGCVHKLQIAHSISLKTIDTVSYNKFSKSRPGRFLGLTLLWRHLPSQKHRAL